MRHTGQKPYQCEYCPYTCIQAISLKTHHKNKHPGVSGSSFSCDLCQYHTVNQQNWLSHFEDHRHRLVTGAEDPQNRTAPSVVDADQSSSGMGPSSKEDSDRSADVPVVVSGDAARPGCLALPHVSGVISSCTNVPPARTSACSDASESTYEYHQLLTLPYLITSDDGSAVPTRSTTAAADNEGGSSQELGYSEAVFGLVDAANGLAVDRQNQQSMSCILEGSATESGTLYQLSQTQDGHYMLTNNDGSQFLLTAIDDDSGQPGESDVASRDVRKISGVCAAAATAAPVRGEAEETGLHHILTAISERQPV